MKAKDNPFSVERVLKIRYRGANLETLAAELERMGWLGAIVGPEGSGKTTLMEDLQAHLEKSGRKAISLFLNDGNPLTRQRRKKFIRELDAETIVFLDGAAAIGRFAWPTLKRKILKKAKGLVITAHRPVKLPTLIECATTPALLRQITADLLADSNTPNDEFLDEIYNACSGNIRLALRQLYDIYTNDEDTRNLKQNEAPDTLGSPNTVQPEADPPVPFQWDD